MRFEENFKKNPITLANFTKFTHTGFRTTNRQQHRKKSKQRAHRWSPLSNPQSRHETIDRLQGRVRGNLATLMACLWLLGWYVRRGRIESSMYYRKASFRNVSGRFERMPISENNTLFAVFSAFYRMSKKHRNRLLRPASAVSKRGLFKARLKKPMGNWNFTGQNYFFYWDTTCFGVEMFLRSKRSGPKKWHFGRYRSDGLL